ncbi:MAG: malate dehydrogenase (oxaloacetate-decarboxylating)(NADP+) [Roseivirga sp.]|jgi:malate dehydrogenase (oxaloacetate-decarboxylating)(NADP+)
METNKKNFAVLHDGQLNKSVAFSREEREALGLRGLLPYTVSTQSIQMKRLMENLRRKESDIERYIQLSSLQNRNERLFYRALIDNIEEIMPLIYTPTVGQACREFSQIFRTANGLFISPEDKGQIRKILDNWPKDDVRVIVVTDGERILGLGDLGANGMGIPIGKLALYSACAGIHPKQCLPVMLDVGTNNEEILNDILYLGYPHKRIRGEAYLELVDEFITAVQDKYPKALIQFEDFLTPNAYALLRKYRNKVLCFNDDIQGTAAVTLAGILASSRITKKPFSTLKIMFLGAGSAATGIADLMVRAFEAEGLTNQEARERLWFVDINGLIVAERTDLLEHNLPYAHQHAEVSFLNAIDKIKPDVLIGATGSPGTFTKDVIERLSAYNQRPVIFALSNPTSRAECTAAEAYTWSRGTAIFASGSPFGKVNFGDMQFKPGQGNNAYIFPGIGLGAIHSQARMVDEEIFLIAAKTLAAQVSEEDINNGAVYPPLTKIRNISLEIAVNVAQANYDNGLARNEKPADLRQSIIDYMFDPTY